MHLHQKLQHLNDAIPFKKLVSLTDENSLHNIQLLDWFIDGGKMFVNVETYYSPYRFAFYLRKKRLSIKLLSVDNNLNFNKNLPLHEVIYNSDIVAASALAYFRKNNNRLLVTESFSRSSGYRIYKGPSKDFRFKKINFIIDFLCKKSPDFKEVKASNNAKDFFY